MKLEKGERGRSVETAMLPSKKPTQKIIEVGDWKIIRMLVNQTHQSTLFPFAFLVFHFQLQKKKSKALKCVAKPLLKNFN